MWRARAGAAHCPTARDPVLLADARLVLPPQLYRRAARSEEHTSELQSLMRISYAVFCLKKKKKQHNPIHHLKKNNIITLNIHHISEHHSDQSLIESKTYL